MGGELSQEEINALLNNPDGSSGENAGATSQGGSDSEQALTAEEKDAFRVFSSTDAYHKFADCLQAAHDGTVTQVASRGKVRCGFYPVDFLERMRPEDKRIRRKSPIAAA